MRSTRPHVLTLLLWAFAGTACAAEKASPSGPESNAVVTVQSLATEAQRFLGQTIRVRGTLENAGSNYFTDLRVQLRDGKGHSVAVSPWLPTSLPPGPKQPGASQPQTLSAFLGKQVELVAEVQHGEMAKAGTVYFLKVKTAELVQ
jgi:hypothetical protein